MKIRLNLLEVFGDRGYSKPILDADGKVVGSITRESGTITTVVSINRNGSSSVSFYNNGGSIMDKELRTTIPYSIESERKIIPFARKAA